METVVTPKNGPTVENQANGGPQLSRFTWKIKDFSRLQNKKKLYSDVFVVWSYKWRVLIFPEGNNVDYLSVYLDVADKATLPCGWSRNAQFSFAVVNQIDSKYTIKKDTKNQFNESESDWGFTNFLRLSDLHDPKKGYLVNDILVVEADVVVLKTVHFQSLERVKEYDFCLELASNHTYDDVVERVAQRVGLDDPSKIRLTPHNFYSQQPKPNPIEYRSVDHLLDMLAHYNQISDILYYELLDIPLPELQRHKTLKVAFHHATKNEAVILNIRLPKQSTVGDVLNEIKTKVDLSHPNAELRLLEVFYHKICKFFPVHEKIENINDRYWTLRAEEISEEEKNLGPNDRLIHVNHFIKTAQNQVGEQRVQNFGEPFFLVIHEGETLAEVKLRVQKKLQVPEEEFSMWKFAFFSLGRPEYLDVSDVVSSRFQRRDVYGAWEQYLGLEHSNTTPKRSYVASQEEKEDKRRYKAQAHLYTIIKVARDDDLKEQIGKDIYFDLVDHDKVRNFRVEKQMSFALFKKEVANEFGIPVKFQRFWIWATRQNNTYRPDRPLTTQEEWQTVRELSEVSNKGHVAELKLFLEVHGLDLCPIPPPKKLKEDILLFFKLYDPEKEELRFVGKFFVKSSRKLIEIITRLNEMAGFAPDQDIELFEEIMFEPSVMCELLDKRATFRFNELEDGDIVCFQKRSSPETEGTLRFPDVPSFLEYVKNRQIVHFRSLERPKEDEFCLELAKNHTYDDVVERVAPHLGLDDPSKIRLTPHNCYSQQPKPNPIKYRSVHHLLDMLFHYNQISNILYYEVLDIPLPELQCLKTLKVAFHHATKDEAVILNIRLPKQSVVGDVLNEIKTKVELSHPNAELRLLEVFYHKICKIFLVHEKIENINDQYWTLHAEEIPEEEKILGPNDQLMHVCRFIKQIAHNKVQIQTFGEPFLVVIHEGETLADLKIRIQKKLQVPGGEFSKLKFACLSSGSPEYLEDSEIVSSRFQRNDDCGKWEMGLEHSDTSLKRSYTAIQTKDIPQIKTKVLKTDKGPTAISPAQVGTNQMLETTQMTLSGTGTQGAEQREALPSPAEDEQSHKLFVDKNVVEEIASDPVGLPTMADEIRHIMNLELEDAAQHISNKLQRILLKIKYSTAKGITPAMETQLQNLMLAAHDLAIDYAGAQSRITEFEQSTQTYRKMDEKAFKAKNAMAANEASMTTLKANIQETLTTKAEAQETILRAEEEIRKAHATIAKANATIEKAKRLQESYTESLNLKCVEHEQLDKDYKVIERLVERCLLDRQIHAQRGSRAEHKLNAARRSWDEIKKNWAELEAVLPAEVYATAKQPTMTKISIETSGEEGSL